ncbi:MAG: Unknown protein [uncultured Sulfurovum sp.]|uniref:Uncharacterized protein n=1 Tax=uncultured Sulfurovum sp. TaxID=269237 RepID=A0A6S6SW67_9BACT|nr:MAG: Unknown protein [uncultured Sulfurovum sp.]
MHEVLDDLAQSYNLEISDIVYIYKSLKDVPLENGNEFMDIDFLVTNATLLSDLSQKFNQKTHEIVTLSKNIEKSSLGEYILENTFEDEALEEKESIEEEDLDDEVSLKELFQEGSDDVVVAKAKVKRKTTPKKKKEKFTANKEKKKITFFHMMIVGLSLFFIFIVYNVISVYNNMDENSTKVTNTSPQEKPVISGGIKYEKPGGSAYDESIKDTISLASKERWKVETQPEKIIPTSSRTEEPIEYIQSSITPQVIDTPPVTEKPSVPEDAGIEMFQEEKHSVSAVCDSNNDKKEYIYFVKNDNSYTPIFEDPSWDEKGIILNSRIIVKSVDEIQGFAEVYDGKYLPTELFTACTPIER